MTTLTLNAAATTAPRRRPAADLGPGFRAFLAIGAGVVLLPILVALARVLTGHAPEGGALKAVALSIHLATVIPAIPLGAWVLLQRKGGPRHRLLGKVWLALMLAAAISAWWIRQVNHGGLSFIHLLVPMVLFGSWRAVATAKRGDIVAHRRVLVGMFVGALLIPAVTAFAPGRLMWMWLFA